MKKIKEILINKNSYKYILSFVLVIVLLVMVGGISYAMFDYSRTGTKENVITTGEIRVAFAEQNNIKLQNRYAETDTQGLANTDPNSQMTFTVSSNITGDATVNYAVGLVDIVEGATLTQDYVKIYLEKNGSAASGFTYGKGNLIKDFKILSVTNYLDSHVISQGSVTGIQTDTYTLKAWIDENYNLPTTDNSNENSHSNQTTSETFSFKIKVIGTDTVLEFRETEKPVCVMSAPADNLMERNSTTTIILNCTDNDSIIEKDLTSSNFTKTGDITISSITKEKTNNGIKYTVNVISGATGGFASIKLNENVISDNDGNKNLVSNTSNLVIKTACDEMPAETTSANIPSLAKNMIPVCYNSTTGVWLKADSTNTDSDYRWYSYSGKSWANAVTVTAVEGSRDDLVDAEVGTVIPMDRINTMLVWIPRFSATGDTANYNGGTKEAPGAFNITFVNKDTTAHDAFDFGGAVSGFWIGKFENSSNETCEPATNSAVGAGCNLTTIRPKILPNATSWRGAMVSTFFYDILAMTENGNQYGFDKTIDTTLDTHMLKNNEWGAVAYLTQSIYGRCTSSTSCTEVGINNNGNFVTGYGAPAGSDYISGASTYVEPKPYNTTQGMDASTTGNIYGVYDMSGGTNEYVMGVYKNEINNSQFTTLPNTKYYNVYNSEYENAGLQHALTETKNWYGDKVNFVNGRYPWFTRGGNYSFADEAGVFAYNKNMATATFGVGSRFSAIIN